MNEPVVKRFSFFQLFGKLAEQKRSIILLIVSSVSALVLFFVTDIFLDQAFSKPVQLILFLGIGYVHHLNLKDNLPTLSGLEKLIFSLFVTAGIVLILLVSHLFFQKFTLLSVLALGCAFLLPYAISLLWQLFSDITFTRFDPWFYHDELPLQKSTVFLNSLPVRFKVLIEEDGEKVQQISFRAPIRMKLGLIFYHMVQEQSSRGYKAIDLTDKNKNTFGWIFYISNWRAWHKSLDPEGTLLENNIKQNSIIIARRISGDHLLQSSSRQTLLSNRTI